MIVEELKYEDLEELKDLYYLCFNIGSNIDKMKESFKYINNDESSKSYVLKNNDKIIGHIKLDIINNLFSDSNPYMYISDLCIHPDYRQKGYGKYLLEYAEKIGKNINCSYIFLNSSKDSAKKFYESLGYHVRASSIYKKNL